VQVERMVDREEWITFLGWEPHWMNITYDMKYLEPVGEPKIAGTTSDVLTVANPKTVADNPELARFLTQFQVQKDTMSEWILEFGYKERRADEVASKWIGANLDKVAVWLDGVKTLDGEPAIDAVRAAYQELSFTGPGFGRGRLRGAGFQSGKGRMDLGPWVDDCRRSKRGVEIGGCFFCRGMTRLIPAHSSI